MRGFQLDEDSKEQSFNTRASGLTGFVGIVVPLAGGAGGLAIDQGIGGWPAVAAGIAFTLALIGLGISIWMTVVKILFPRQSSAIAINTIQRYPTWQYVSKSRVMVQGEIMRGLVSALAVDRQRNSDKATWLRRAYTAFLFGAAFLVAFGGIVVIDAL